jgi:hypothetical protein
VKPDAVTPTPGNPVAIQADDGLAAGVPQTTMAIRGPDAPELIVARQRPAPPTDGSLLSEQRRLRVERQRLRQEVLVLHKEQAESSRRRRELDKRERELVRQQERMSQERQALERERDQLRSERLTLTDLRRQARTTDT